MLTQLQNLDLYHIIPIPAVAAEGIRPNNSFIEKYMFLKFYFCLTLPTCAHTLQPRPRFGR